MTADPGDQARVSVLVGAPVEVTFRAFTEEIDQWWRRGFAYRVAGPGDGIVHLETHVGGRLYESIETPSGTRVVESGRVLVWQPPHRLVLEWRAQNFAPDEQTEVEVEFAPSASGGTLVTVTHRGWSRIRADHPARHGHDVRAFLRMMGLWWGELASSLRVHLAERA